MSKNILFLTLLVLTIAQESWGQTASKYRVGQTTKIVSMEDGRRKM